MLALSFLFGSLTRLFSTHPPLHERIRRLRAYRAPKAQSFWTEVAPPTV